MKTHRHLYPEQYAHPIVGKRVRVKGTDVSGKVERVIGSRFGQLVILEEHGSANAWELSRAVVTGAGDQPDWDRS